MRFFDKCMLYCGCILLFVLASVPTAFAVNELSYEVDYTSNEWKYMSYADKVKSLNIAPEKLKDISTADVLNLALEYPLGLTFMAFDSFEKGFLNLIEISSVYKELMDRKDLSEAVFKQYASLVKEYDNSKDWIKKVMLEGIIRYGCWDSLNITEKGFIVRAYEEIDDWKEILEPIIEPYKENNNVQMIFGEQFSIMANGFTWNGGYTSFNSAIYYTGTYKKYGVTSSCYKYYYGEFTDTEKTNIYNYVSSNFPSWIFSSPASKKYNCHSYVWISNDTYNNIYWLDDPSVFANATYYFIAGTLDSSLVSGQYAILYDASGTPLHSVKVNTTSTGSNKTAYMSSSYVQSKVGAWGLYVTTMLDMYNLYGATTYRPYTVL